ncbi:hypothetical protein I4F81_001554 [Pyropia yezoensis]|uniref:Uncharacterized protein n=1 Tax=Pyropia yezoensis TaxID=2788 RepID=A0ACC3BLZ6_PYRYE|nr:hypothetical protein I4F81_001554 [Neopyropia yezoensis]
MAVYTAGPRLLPYLEDIHGLSAGDLGAGSGGRHLIVSVGGSSKSGRPPWGLTPRAPLESRRQLHHAATLNIERSGQAR